VVDHRVFNASILLVITLLVGGLFALNTLIDPYGVFQTSSMPDGPSSNERYLKIEHLKAGNERFEMLIFGSSRSGMTDPEWVENRTGLNAYNLSVFSGRPSDWRNMYRAYRQFGEPPKAVMIGVDAMAFLREPEAVDLSRRHHPSVDEAGTLSYWLDYLLAPSLWPALEKANAAEEPNISFNWRKGTYSLIGYDKQIEADHAAYRAKTFDTWKARAFQSAFDEREWQRLTSWLGELAEDQVEVTVFLQPMHRQWKERMAPLMPEVRKRLSQISHLIDLSALGSDEDELWYEQRHYREPIAKAVVEHLFGKGDGNQNGSRRAKSVPSPSGSVSQNTLD